MTSPDTATPAVTFQDYADRGRHAIWRYIVTVVLAFVAEIIASLVLIVVLVLLVPGESMTELLHLLQDPAYPVYFFTTIGISFLALALGLAACMPLLHRKRAADLLGNWTWRLFALGVAVWLVVLVVGSGIDYALRPEGFTLHAGAIDPAVTALIIASLAIQTFAEEYIFRGYITQGLLRLIRRPWVVSIVSGLIFGALHIPNGKFQAVSATLLGIVLTWIAIRTGSIAFGFGLHLINNVFGAIIIVSAGDVFKGSPALITQSTPGLDYVDLGLVGVALVGLVVAMARRYPAPRATA